MRKIREAFAKLGCAVREDFYKLKHGFTACSFFTVLFGLVLLGGNAYLFVASAIKMFVADGTIVGLLHFSGGLLGFLISCLLIFFITLHFSVTPQEGVSDDDNKVFSDKMPGGRKGSVLSLLLVMLIAFGGGATALGVYISGEAEYSGYPKTTAVVVDLENMGFDRGYRATYEYIVDGETFRAKGPSSGSGEGVPRIGDTVTIRYNPLNPRDIRISTESKFLLGFGCFMLFFGFLTIAFWLHSAKILKTQFFLAFILLGLTACIFVMYLSTVEFRGLTEFFGRNFMLHFILMFTNVGLLELVNGIVYLGYKEKQ